MSIDYVEFVNRSNCNIIRTIHNVLRFLLLVIQFRPLQLPVMKLFQDSKNVLTFYTKHNKSLKSVSTYYPTNNCIQCVDTFHRLTKCVEGVNSVSSEIVSGYQENGEWIQYKKLVHENEGKAKECFCDSCGKGFVCKAYLNHHLKMISHLN